MWTTLLYPSTHAIMGSGDKLYDEGLCGALWAAVRGIRYQQGTDTTGVPHMVWNLKPSIINSQVPLYNSVGNMLRLGKTTKKKA
jgi:hypothetical protein